MIIECVCPMLRQRGSPSSLRGAVLGNLAAVSTDTCMLSRLVPYNNAREPRNNCVATRRHTCQAWTLTSFARNTTTALAAWSQLPLHFNMTPDKPFGTTPVIHHPTPAPAPTPTPAPVPTPIPHPTALPSREAMTVALAEHATLV